MLGFCLDLGFEPQNRQPSSKTEPPFLEGTPNPQKVHRLDLLDPDSIQAFADEAPGKWEVPLCVR